MDTEVLPFYEKLDSRDDLFQENHGTVDDCATNIIVGLKEILNRIFLISNSKEKRHFIKILEFSFSFAKCREHSSNTSHRQKMKHVMTRTVIRKLEINGFRRVEFQPNKIKINFYMKDAAEVLQYQMNLTPAAEIVIAPANSKPHDTITGSISPSINAKISYYGFHATETLMYHSRAKK